VITTIYKLLLYNYLWIDDGIKYYVIIYQSLVKTSNDLNEKLSKNSSA